MDGAEFVMRASGVEYHAPARFDDLLECFVRAIPEQARGAIRAFEGSDLSE